MLVDPAFGEPVLSFVAMADDVRDLRGHLDANGIDLSADAESDGLAKIVESLPDYASAPLDRRPSLPETARAIGFAFFARLLRQTRDCPGMYRFKRHLRHFVGAGTGASFSASADQSQERDFLFELFTAALFAKAGFEVWAEEPDIVAAKNGERWAVSCKTTNGSNDTTLGDAIEKGIKQALAVDGADVLVCLGVGNKLNHERFLPVVPNTTVHGFFLQPGPAGGLLHAEVDLVRDALVRLATPLDEAATGRFQRGREATRFRGIAVVAQTVCALPKALANMSMVGVIPRWMIFSEHPPSEIRLEQQLHGAAYKVIG